MVDISFLQKKLSWQNNKVLNIDYKIFNKKDIDVIRHFVSNNKNYNYFIILNKVLVIKSNARY